MAVLQTSVEAARPRAEVVEEPEELALEIKAEMEVRLVALAVENFLRELLVLLRAVVEAALGVPEQKMEVVAVAVVHGLLTARPHS